VHDHRGYNLWAPGSPSSGSSTCAKTTFHWCTADVGWIHRPQLQSSSWAALRGATTVMYEGAPRASKRVAFLGVIEKHKVSCFYTLPTAIRAFMRSAASARSLRHGSLRILERWRTINPKPGSGIRR